MSQAHYSASSRCAGDRKSSPSQCPPAPSVSTLGSCRSMLRRLTRRGPGATELRKAGQCTSITTCWVLVGACTLCDPPPAFVVTDAKERPLPIQASQFAACRKGPKRGCAVKGGAFQWVQGPPGEIAPAGSNRSRHGGDEMSEASR